MNYKIALTGSLATFAFAVAAQAASQNYGTFVSDNVTFNNVIESSSTAPLPLLKAPTSFAEDSLSFGPIEFGAESVNIAGSKIVDSQLRTVISSHSGIGIDTISIFESGDYTLVGLPTDFAVASVAAPVFIDIIEVDGVAVNGPQMSINLVFSPNGGSYMLSDGIATGVIWEGDVTIDIAQLAADNGILGDVTGVDLTFDNTLIASSSTSSAAFIKKKQASIEVELVPEPASAALLALGLFGIARRGH